METGGASLERHPQSSVGAGFPLRKRNGPCFPRWPIQEPSSPRRRTTGSCNRRPMTKQYDGFIPPCAVYCGGCPRFTRQKNSCLGAAEHCRLRRCKGIYVCCVERKGLSHCFECNSYPCARYRRFATTWLPCGQDLLANQQLLKELGPERWLQHMQRCQRSKPHD